jgi:hypothetical protein
VDKYSLKSLNSQSEVVIFGVYYMATRDIEYWFFKSDDGGKFRRIYEMPATPGYSEDELRFFTLGSDDFIEINQSSGGTGISYDENEIYWMGKDGPRKVLEWPINGYSGYPWVGIGLDFTGTPIKTIGQSDELTSSLLVKYLMTPCYDSNGKRMGGSEQLFEKNIPYCFRWDPKEGTLKLDKKRSGWDRDPGQFFDHPDSDCLEYWYEDLEKIAKSNDEKKKKWLSCFLHNLKVQSNDQYTKAMKLIQLMK